MTPDSNEEKTENLLVKIPPNDPNDREMAQMVCRMLFITTIYFFK